MVRPPLTDSVLAGDVGGLVGREECHRGRDVGGLADPAQRDGAGQPVPQLLAVGGHLVEQRGVGRAGADAVDRDAVPGHLPGQCLAEGDDAALGSRVHHLARGADAAGVRGDVDDPPAAPLDHPVQHGAGDGHGAAQVDRDDLVPGLFGRVHEKLDHVDARVVDQDVRRSQLGAHPADRGPHRRAVRDVHSHADGLHAVALGEARRRLGGRRAVQVTGRDRRALGGQGIRDRRANASAGPGDHRCFSLQPHTPSAEPPHTNMYNLLYSCGGRAV